ncbi:MAG: hypothetical protein QOF21_116 [Actinomycetota bacterium]|jgi:hypothetical protein
MTENEQPLQLPPKPAAPAPRRWPRRTAATVLLAASLVAGLLVIQDARSPKPTRLSAATTSTTSVIPVPTTIVGTPPPPPVAKRTRVRGAVVEATTTTTIEEVPASRPGTPELVVKVDALAVDDEHTTGFDPTLFGSWKDADGDGCNTRSEVLIAQSTEPVERVGICRIVSGRWVSPYDNVVLTDTNDVAVDLLVAMREAWESGAWHWTDAQRNAYLNDMETVSALKVVSEVVNDDKAEKDPKEWLPPEASYLCDYLRSWVEVKTKWRLSVDPGEREAIAVKAIGC